MSINGIGNSAASWAQFVKLTHAARERSSGLSADSARVGNATSAPQTANSVSFKRIADVYSSSAKQPAQNVQTLTSLQNEMTNRRVVGGQFDTYA
ncbi:MAG: hypothetical protein LBU70_08255 [Chitinispirillales bacterium]|jgi:hypothetical protein|nr:hypothetical protein [Chitinispirillales bacterium]